MSDAGDVLGFVLCLGGLNPLCWMGCSSEDRQPEPIIFGSQDGGKADDAGVGADTAAAADVPVVSDAPDASGGTPDAGSDSVDAGAPVNPKVRAGFNGEFASPTLGFQSCSVHDLDIKGNKLIGMCGPMMNRLFTIGLDAGDPMASTSAQFGQGAPEMIAGVGTPDPVQVFEAGNGYAIPFSAGTAASSTNGVTFIDQGGDASTKIVGPLGQAIPTKLGGGVVAMDAVGAQRLYLTASDASSDDMGLLLSYPMTADGALDVHGDGTSQGIAAKGPLAMAMINDAWAAVVNPSVEIGPSLEIIDVTSMAADPAVESIPLPEVPLSLPELAINEGKTLAVIPTENGKLMVVDLVSMTAGGTVELAGNARDVTISGTKAYVSTPNAVQIVDISDPGNPAIEQTIEQVYDLGSIAVHSSGVIFVAATARWWEGQEAAAACLNGDPGVLCRTHIIAIDPDNAEPWNGSNAGN